MNVERSDSWTGDSGKASRVKIKGPWYYSVSIAEEIRKRFGKPVSLGAVYATVDRLEKKRLISSSLSDPTPERGGKPKRLYAIKASGERALAEVREAETRLWAGMPPMGAPI